MSAYLSLAVRMLVGACLALVVLSAHATGPYNTTSDDQDKNLMLKGHDPVAYFTDGRHVLGTPAIKTEYDGVVYRFASEEHKQMFLREPEKYAPQFGGFCSNGMAYAIPWGGDPDTWAIIDGKLYIFGGQSSKNYFMMDETRNLKLAQMYWKEEVEGSNAFAQRVKRLVFRVPHYKTGKELQAEWEARQAKGGAAQ